MSFFRWHRGATFASSVLREPISRAFVAEMERFAKRNHVPLITFTKQQRKDDVAHEYLAKFTQAEGVLFIGQAQEKTPVFRTEQSTLRPLQSSLRSPQSTRGSKKRPLRTKQ